MKKVFKSQSVQILLLGAIVCTLMAAALMFIANKFEFDAPMSVVTVFAGAFTTIVVGRKGRDLIQSNRGIYYDEEEQKLKNVEQ